MSAYYVWLFEHPQSISNGGRKLEMHVTDDGMGGIPLDEIDKYISAGIITPITSVKWRLPGDSCVELYPGRFWKGSPCVLIGDGNEQALDLRDRMFDDKTRSAIIRRNTRQPWCVHIYPANPINAHDRGWKETIYASSEGDAYRQAGEIWNRAGVQYGMNLSHGACTPG